MNPLTAQQIADILGARVTAGSADALASGGVCTDTRRLSPGALFVALRGENFDGDAFAQARCATGRRWPWSANGRAIRLRGPQ